MKKHAWLFFVLLILFCVSSSYAVKIQWLGHSAFLFKSQEGAIVITDPYKSSSFNGKVMYAPITTKADIVTISHNHDDHNFTESISGTPEIIKSLGTSTVDNIVIRGIPSYHDKEQGANRGSNNIYVFIIDGLHICHLGDLGHLLNKTEIRQIEQSGKVDVLLVPVGGVYTIDGNDATEVIKQLNPKLVIPMHYKTEKMKLALKTVDEFIRDKKNVIQRNTSILEVTTKSLPKEQQITVLQPAM